ncbi:unnamed protein product [Amoebophrya sp. A120]|nr:unnamed protein product [Amoebophrya sp. A120]|eukprot:GSA120T00000009001.1
MSIPSWGTLSVDANGAIVRSEQAERNAMVQLTQLKFPDEDQQPTLPRNASQRQTPPTLLAYPGNAPLGAAGNRQQVWREQPGKDIPATAVSPKRRSQNKVIGMSGTSPPTSLGAAIQQNNKNSTSTSPVFNTSNTTTSILTGTSPPAGPAAALNALNERGNMQEQSCGTIAQQQHNSMSSTSPVAAAGGSGGVYYSSTGTMLAAGAAATSGTTGAATVFHQQNLPEQQFISDSSSASPPLPKERQGFSSRLARKMRSEGNFGNFLQNYK